MNENDKNGLSDRLVDQSEAGKILKCSRVKLYTLRKQHQLPHYRVGGRLFFDKADLESFLVSTAATLPAN